MDDPLYVIGCGLWRIIIVHLSVGNKHRTKERSLLLYSLLFNDYFTIFITLRMLYVEWILIWYKTPDLPFEPMSSLLSCFLNSLLHVSMCQLEIKWRKRNFVMERECFN